MFDLNQLRCFVTVAEELHFGRAAARLNMTQPPLSRQIQVLEHIIDAPLLERTSRSVRLTPAGRSFLPEARRILKLAESASQVARQGDRSDNRHLPHTDDDLLSATIRIRAWRFPGGRRSVRPLADFAAA